MRKLYLKCVAICGGLYAQVGPNVGIVLDHTSSGQKVKSNWLKTALLKLYPRMPLGQNK